MAGHAHAAGAGLGTVVAGAYRSLWDSQDMGITLDGFTLSQSNSGIDITADITGDTVIDTIYAGTTLSITVTLENWNAQAIEPMIWWHGNGTPALYEWGVSDGVGLSQWQAAKPLILYACQSDGTTISEGTISNASTATAANPYIDPLDIIFPKTRLRKDSNIDMVFSFRPRFLTLTLDVYPISNFFEDASYQVDFPYNAEPVSDCSSIRYFSATRGQGPT